jgi:hypothetical protein
MRLDHLLLSPELARRLTAAGVSRQVRAEEGASDHAPTWIELKPQAKPFESSVEIGRPGFRRPPRPRRARRESLR